MTEHARATPSPSRTTLAVLALGYLLLRAINLLELALAAQSQAASGAANPLGRPSDYFVHTETPASPGVLEVLTNWDGQWYERIATEGYPTGPQNQSPNDAWAWAFPPAFPMAARAVMRLTGMDFTLSAVTLNLLLGAAATLLLFLLFRHGVSDPLAVVAALLVGAFPSAPLFTLSFSEPLALLLLVAAMLSVVTHRHWWTIPLVFALALTRPVAAPLAAVLILHWWNHHRPAPSRGANRTDTAALGLGTLAALASPWLWGMVSGLFLSGTGPASSAGVDRTASIIHRFDFGWLGAIERSAGFGTLLLFLALVAGVLGCASLTAIQLRLPPEIVVWGVSYVAFILLVTPLHTAIVRYLLLAAPLLVAIPVRALGWRRLAGAAFFVLLLGASLWVQWLWIRYIYVLDPAPALRPFAA